MAVTAARTTAETFDVSRDLEIEACTSAASLFKLEREVTRRGGGRAFQKARSLATCTYVLDLELLSTRPPVCVTSSTLTYTFRPLPSRA